MEKFSKTFAAYGFKLEALAPVYGLAESTVGLLFPAEKRIFPVDYVQRQPFEQDNKAIPATTSDDKKALSFVGCGQVLPGHSIRIVDDLGNALEDREVGNLQFQGPSSMLGYYNNPDGDSTSDPERVVRYG